MNTENRILTLDPELIENVRRQVEAWNGELFDPWRPSHAALGIVQIIRNCCPRMENALEAAGIFEPWAEILHDKILNLAQFNRTIGLSPSEAESEARKDLIPCYWEMEEEWLVACCIDYEPEEDAELDDLEDPWDNEYDEPDDEAPHASQLDMFPLLKVQNAD